MLRQVDIIAYSNGTDEAFLLVFFSRPALLATSVSFCCGTCYVPTVGLDDKENITKTHLFKYTENCTTKK